MKNSILLSAAFAAAVVCSLSAETITVPAGETVRPEKAITGDVLVKEGAGTLDLSGVVLKTQGLKIADGAVLFSAKRERAPTTVTARNLRWTITGTRPNAQYSGSGPQFSEFRLFFKGQPVAIPAGTTSSSVNHAAHEGADKGFDGDLHTKCYQSAPFILHFPCDVTFDAYSFATANDAIGRDPRDWVLEAGEQGKGRMRWQTIGAEQGFTAPEARFAEAGTSFRVAPGGGFPVDYPVEVCGKGRLVLDGMGGRPENLSGDGLVELKGCGLTLPADTAFTGTVSGGQVRLEKAPLFP